MIGINYSAIEILHESSHGTAVAKVVDKETQKPYALKLIGPLSDRLMNIVFKREVSALKTLNRFDDIVRILDSDTGLVFRDRPQYGGILLEYIEGESLLEADISGYSQLERMNLCMRIADAVLHAHQSGILHRDLKPSNIMLVGDSVKIIDFGSSKIKAFIDNESIHGAYTTGYVAPELANGLEATEASDVYSLGVVFCEILAGIKLDGRELPYSKVDSIEQKDNVKELLKHMSVIDPDLRISDLSEVSVFFKREIGDLNAQDLATWFYVETRHLGDLKRADFIPGSTTMQQLLLNILPNEFDNMYGLCERQECYKFVGEHLYAECSLDEQLRCFRIDKIYEIAVDTRTRFIRKFCKVEGKKHFIYSSTQPNGINSSRRLSIRLKSYEEERRSEENRTLRFNELFGKWIDSLNESKDTILGKMKKVHYDSYRIQDKKLYLNLKDSSNSDIELMDEETGFIYEFETGDGKVRPGFVGDYDELIYEEGTPTLVISLSQRIALSRLREYLDANSFMSESHLKKTVAIKRQLDAISALRYDQYSAKGLKDIILELDTPEIIASISEPKFCDERLNDSQKRAVRKALSSSSISLIQGPPGTGKTSVISEIVWQVISKSSEAGDLPKILIVSQSNAPVDNVIESISQQCLEKGIRVVRIGDKAKMSALVRENHTIDAVRDNLFLGAREKCIKYVSDMIDLNTVGEDSDLQNAPEEQRDYKKWCDVKEIQDDWLKRCGDFEALKYQIINSSSIISGTCVGFLSDEYIKDIEFDYVIVDEAAKAATPELLVSIIKAKKIVLVGDQNQLPPFADETLSPLMKMLVGDPKYRLFDILYTTLPDEYKQMLDTQYRMIKNIGDLISTVFYDGKITTGIDDEKRRHNIRAFGKCSIIWYDTSNMKDHDEKSPRRVSYMNVTEANLIKNILAMIDRQSSSDSLDIGIITAYNAQKEQLSKVVANATFERIKKVDINTLDAFQGRENDIIIYSTVRTDRSIGFQNKRERINVAFSRAKRLLIVCGDMDFFNKWDRSENKYVEIISYIKKHTNECRVIDGRTVL